MAKEAKETKKVTKVTKDAKKKNIKTKFQEWTLEELDFI